MLWVSEAYRVLNEQQGLVWNFWLVVVADMSQCQMRAAVVGLDQRIMAHIYHPLAWDHKLRRRF